MHHAYYCNSSLGMCAGENVVELVVVMSAYMDACLHNCLQPYVSIADPATKYSLCEYHLENKRAELASKKAVVMCRIFRASRSNSWEVQAVGQVLNNGDASNYQPILGWIKAQNWQL